MAGQQGYFSFGDLAFDNPEYEAFVGKFKPKKTTDDCYTPPIVYEAVLGWVAEKYGVDREKILRPFYPGGDYERAEYPAGWTVVDNPPFSIISKICAFYLDRDIPFFLFAPTLTALAGKDVVLRMNHIFCDADITYENGARVCTAFVTNLGERDTVIETAPDLQKIIKEADAKARRERRVELPKHEYPDNVLTAAMANSLANVPFKVKRGDCAFTRALDAQKGEGKALYGGGLLLSDSKAAEKKAAKRKSAEKRAAQERLAEARAAERRAAERRAAEGDAFVWRLSEREREIIDGLGRKEG